MLEAESITDPDFHEPPTATPEQRLWTGVLVRLIHDAQNHVTGAGEKSRWQDFEQAHHDILRCGPQICHVCDKTGHNPQAISDKFREWVAGSE